MNLFKFDNYQVIISPEALNLKAFRTIWTRDRTSGKNIALKELSYLYFFCDPRSEYQYIVDDNDRSIKVIQDIGFDKKWKIDNELQNAIILYKELVNTTSALLLQDCRCAVDKVRETLRNIDMKEEVDGKRINTPATVLKSVKEAVDLIGALDNIERKIKQELINNGKMRGSGEKTISDDGL